MASRGKTLFSAAEAVDQITSAFVSDGVSDDISSEDEDYGGVERVDDNNDVISSEQSEVDSDNNEDSDVMNNDNENSDDEQLVGTNGWDK